MKKLILAAVLITSIFSYSQETQSIKKANKSQKEKLSPEQRLQALLDKMTIELNLDAQQQEQIKPIFAEQASKLQALRDQGNVVNFKELSKEERRALMQKRQEEKAATDVKLKVILSPEQFAKMKEIEMANREKMREARESRQGGEEIKRKDLGGNQPRE